MLANSIDREFSSKQWTEQWRQTNQTAGEEIEGRGCVPHCFSKMGGVVKVYIFLHFSMPALQLLWYLLDYNWQVGGKRNTPLRLVAVKGSAQSSQSSSKAILIGQDTSIFGAQQEVTYSTDSFLFLPGFSWAAKRSARAIIRMFSEALFLPASPTLSASPLL